MIKNLSILMPSYNNACLGLVKTLQAQAAALHNLHYEIIVADDGSTDVATKERNRAINEYENCRYIERKENVGRAAIRNFLARISIYDWLLFVDSDLDVDNPHFVYNYIKAEDNVVVGGLKIGGNQQLLKHNLRYRYEKACEEQHDYKHRKLMGNKEFRTTNFLISRKVIMECPFDENFKWYGYEDVLLGKDICDKGYSITHIDNPIVLNDFEGNYKFLQKSEEACRTLHMFREELSGYSKLIEYSDRIDRMLFVKPLLKALFPLLSIHIKAMLTGNNPSVLLFNIYKLLYYINLNKAT